MLNPFSKLYFIIGINRHDQATGFSKVVFFIIIIVLIHFLNFKSNPLYPLFILRKELSLLHQNLTFISIRK